MNELIVTTVPVVFEESECDVAYDKIDHFLRSSLDDSDYAEYSAALDIVFTAGDAEQLRTENARLVNVIGEHVAVRVEQAAEIAECKRENEELRFQCRVRQGYAPGGYMNKCRSCGSEFVGDKRAITCLDCANKVVKAAIDAAMGATE